MVFFVLKILNSLKLFHYSLKVRKTFRKHTWKFIAISYMNKCINTDFNIIHHFAKVFIILPL